MVPGDPSDDAPYGRPRRHDRGRALRRHRTHQLEERLALGEVWQETGPVFTHEHGGAINPRLFSSWLPRGASCFSDSATRYTDASPWNGGDAIEGANGEGCTSGFGVQDATLGRYYLLTAGHCGNTTFYNGGSEIGSSLSGSVLRSVIDSQLISTGSSCISWGGLSTEPSNDVRYFITGYFDPPQGAGLLEEGSASHEQSVTVSIYDWSGTVDGESLEDIDLLQPQSVGGGDSGGTVVYPTKYGPLAGGTIVGVDAFVHDGQFQSYDVMRLIDSELYTYSSFLGSQLLPNVTKTGDSC